MSKRVTRWDDTTTYLGVGLHNVDISHLTRLKYLLEHSHVDFKSGLRLSKPVSQMDDLHKWGFVVKKMDYNNPAIVHWITMNGMKWMFFMADKEVWHDPLIGGFPDI